MTLTCSSHFNILLFFFFFLFFPLVLFSSEFAQHSTQLSPSSSLSSQWWTQESSPAEISIIPYLFGQISHVAEIIGKFNLNLPCSSWLQMPSVQATSEPSREPVSLPSMLDEYPQSLPLQCGDKPENKLSDSYN